MLLSQRRVDVKRTRGIEEGEEEGELDLQEGRGKSGENFTITGILENVPENSSLQFDILLPYAFLERIGRTNESFGSNSIQTFVRLKESSAFQAANEKILGFIRTKNPQSRTDLELLPYKRMHLHSYWGYEKDPGAVQYVYIFSIIAFFVLLIACINFMNLSTARSAKRAKEVGLRKVSGAHRSHLIRQFYGESIVISFMALILAVFVACLGLFGLASFTSEQRTKEIGVRKTLGATAVQVLVLLCREFFMLVFPANIIAWPISYLIMRSWLQGYAYRTSLNVFIFLGAMAAAMLTALISVGFQSFRAASMNPADALRYE